MAFQQNARLKWMQKKIHQSFPELPEDEIMGYFLLKKHHIKTFMDNSISKLFFFYQPQSETSNKSQLFMSTGEHEKVLNKCVYFINTSNRPIKTHISSDETVLYGELTSNILEILQGTLSSLYQPLLNAQEQWGEFNPKKENHMYSCRFGTFLYDNVFSRLEKSVPTTTVSLWSNLLYGPAAQCGIFTNPYYHEHPGVLYPSFCGKQINLWRDYWLRWQGYELMHHLYETPRKKFPRIVSSDYIRERVYRQHLSQHKHVSQELESNKHQLELIENALKEKYNINVNELLENTNETKNNDTADDQKNTSEEDDQDKHSNENGNEPTNEQEDVNNNNNNNDNTKNNTEPFPMSPTSSTADVLSE